MGKASYEVSQLQKNRRMRNTCKKRKREQQAMAKRAVAEAAIAQKISDGVKDQKALAEKYYTKWKNISKKADELRRRIPVQSHIRKISVDGAAIGNTLSTKMIAASVKQISASDLLPLAENTLATAPVGSGTYGEIIIAGDMNVPDIDWSYTSVKTNPQYSATVNQTMIDLIDDHGLTQLVTFPTRQESVLDLVLTTHPDLVQNLASVQGISDHSAVSFDLNLSVKLNKKKPRTVYKFAKANLTDIRREATTLSEDFFERQPDNISIESNWEFFKSGIMDILNRRVPNKKSGSWSNCPWMTRDLKTALRKKKRLYNNYKKSGKACDKEKYRAFQKLFQINMKKAQDEFIADTLNSDLKDKPKKFWSYIKSKRQDQVGIPPLKENGLVKTDSASKAEILSNQFQQVFTQEDLTSIPNKGHSEIPMMSSILFNKDGVEKLLKNLDSKKASGPDKIPTTLLKETASEIADVVTFLFNQSYCSGQLPEDWRNADLARNIDNGDQIDLLILDFSKAFYKVAHGRLISKLSHYGIQGKTLAWIESWLTNRTQRVVVDGVSSNPVDVTSGVPQGTVLGPLMFLLFINDMHENLECTLRLFADDALLYRKISEDYDTSVLQRDLDKVGLWAERWQMVFNPTKCYKMSVYRKKTPVLKDYTLYNQKLSGVKHHPYLGVQLSDDLRWNLHVNKIVNKANSVLGFIKRNLYSCSEDTKRIAYTTLVRPHLEYAAAVWDPYRQEQVDKIEAVQRRAVFQGTIILNLNKSNGS
ncbi:uncharacterized protein LOC114526557 [Dendronephthya gigantea]|uniref:uncharacterized protein LOC114526557 n=1 Tax=Dendronephthya gigantea TaxID=151771 RepID=UPI00106A48C6|nr:uncharacterized protein LOC114526557 [Dendronephthya gigantea]